VPCLRSSFLQVPRHHERLLPRRGGRAGGLRRDPPRDVRERGAVAPGAAGPHGRQHRGHAGGQQGRPAPPPRRLARGRRGLRGAARHLLHGDVRAGRHQRRARLRRGAPPDLPRREPERARHRRGPRRAAEGQDHRRRRRQGRGLARERGRVLLGLSPFFFLFPFPPLALVKQRNAFRLPQSFLTWSSGWGGWRSTLTPCFGEGGMLFYNLAIAVLVCIHRSV
jgi:hypothetical protein